MPASLRSSASTPAQATGTFTVTAPGAIVDGDVLLFIQACQLGGGTAPASQTGFTLLGRGTFNGASQDLSFWKKTANGESGNYTWNNASGGLPGSAVWALCITGVDPTTGRISSITTGTSTTALTGSAAPGPNAGAFLTAGIGIGAIGSDTITSNNGYTDLGTIQGGGASRLQVSWLVGTTQPMSATINNSDDWGCLLAIFDAGGAPPPPGGAGSRLPAGDADDVPMRPFQVRTPSRRTGRRKK